MFLLFIPFSHATQEVENPAKKMKLIRFILAETRVAKDFLRIVNDDYRWINERIFFGSSINKKRHYYGQVQFYFIKSINGKERHKSLSYDFIWDDDKNVIINLE